MRRLRRPPLCRKAWVWLSLRTREVLVAADPKKKADDLWRATRGHRYRAEVYEALTRMASGVMRCMYCEDSAGHPVEHFWPKARFPERAFCWENLLVICGKCNGYKAAQFPNERAEPLLIDPTAEDPAAHLFLDPRQGKLVAREGSLKGQNTIDVLKLNRWELEQGRQTAWVRLQALLVFYSERRASGRHERAELCKRAICEMPFSALLHFMVRVFELPDPARYLHDPDDLEVLRALTPELHTWLEGSSVRR